MAYNHLFCVHVYGQHTRPPTLMSHCVEASQWPTGH